MRLTEEVVDYLNSYERVLDGENVKFLNNYELTSILVSKDIEEELEKYAIERGLTTGNISDISQRVCQYLISNPDQRNDEYQRDRTLESYYLNQLEPYVTNQKRAVDSTIESGELRSDSLFVGLRKLDVSSPVDINDLGRIVQDICDNVNSFLYQINQNNPKYPENRQGIKDHVIETIALRVKVVKNDADIAYGECGDSMNHKTDELKDATTRMEAQDVRRRNFIG